MGITAEIINSIAKAVKSFFYEGTPVLFVEKVAEIFPFIGIAELEAAARKHKDPGFIVFIKGIEELAPELCAEHLDGYEELSAAVYELHGRRKASAGDDAVDMGMVIKFLPPGMQHLYESRHSAEIFPVSRQFHKGPGGRIMEKGVKELLVGINKRVEFSRNGKNDMKVCPVNDFRTAGIYPELFKDSLAVRAVPVAAGVVMDFLVPALIADGDVAAEGAGFTGHDGQGGPFLPGSYGMV